jgi:hypothetical protein
MPVLMAADTASNTAGPELDASPAQSNVTVKKTAKITVNVTVTMTAQEHVIMKG